MKKIKEKIVSEEMLAKNEYIQQLINNGYIQQLVGSDNIENQKFGKKIIKIVMDEIKNVQRGEKIFSEKTRYTNKPCDVDGYTVYINTITENNRIFPYILMYSQNMREDAEVLVDTLNTRNSESTKDRIDVLIKGIVENALYIRKNVPTPIVYVYCPKEDFQREPYYQQLARKCFTESDRKYERCDVLVRETIQDAQKKLEELSGKKVSDKIVLNGYSTSGVFAQRFAMIHPEMISKAIIGGAAGSIPIPTEELGYPLGTKDFEKLFGKKFNEESYRKIEFAYYVGEFEAKEKSNRRDENGNIVPMHDMSYLSESVPEDIGAQYRNIFGKDLNERFIKVVEWYKKNGYKIVGKIYKDANHADSFRNKDYRFIENYYKDMLEFSIEGTNGEGFKNDESSAEKIIMFSKESGFDDCMQDSTMRMSNEEKIVEAIKEIVQNKEITIDEISQSK